MAQRAIQVLLQAITGPYEAAMGRAAGTTKAFEATVENSSRATGRADAAIGGMSAKLVAGGGLLVGLNMAKDRLLSYEDALVGVGKTTGLAGDDLQALGDELTELAGNIDGSAEDMLGIAQSAAQLGVANEDIAAFTESVAGIASATALTVDQAATDFARLSNITGTPISEIERMGSTVVELGNTMATTEPEILNMAQRIASAGTQAGLTTAEVLGLSAAASALGLEAEAGGTALSQTLITIGEAAIVGGDELETFAQTAGVSGTEFARLWESEPTEALVMFLEGLDRVQQGGGNTVAILDDVGLGGLRVSDALRRTSAGADGVEAAFASANQAYEDNIALSEEVETANATASVAMDNLKDSFDNFLRVTAGGEEGASGIATVADALSDIVDVVGELDLLSIVTAANADGLVDGLIGWATGSDEAAESTGDLVDEHVSWMDYIDPTTQGLDDIAGAADGVAESYDDATVSLSEFLDTQRAAVDPAFALINAQTELAAAQNELISLQESGEASASDLEQAHMAAADAAFNFAAAAVEASESTGDAEASIEAMGDAGLLTADQVEVLRDMIRGAESDADSFAREYRASVGLDIDMAGLTEFEQSLSRLLGRRVVVPVGIDSEDAFVETLRPERARAKGGRVAAGLTYRVNEQGDEAFIPDRPGMVVDANSTAMLMAALRNGGSGAVEQKTFSPSVTVMAQTPSGRDDISVTLRKLALAGGYV